MNLQTATAAGAAGYVPPHYFPNYNPEPPLPAPDWGRIVWVPVYIPPPVERRPGCDACRRSGICMCVRPSVFH